MMNILQNLLQSWNNENIRYCHWKGSFHIKDGVDGISDLDILLSKNDQNLAEHLLCKNGFLKFKTQHLSSIPDVYDWLGFDYNTGKILHIHLHYYMISGKTNIFEYSIPWIEKVLQSRVFNEEFNMYTINPELELLLFYIRLGLEDKKIIEKDKRYFIKESTSNEISFLKEQCDRVQLNVYASELLGKYNNAILNIIDKQVLYHDDIIELNKISSELFSGCIRENRFRNSINILKKTLVAFGVNKFEKKLKGKYILKKIPMNKKGLTIAFLGQDGSGKSTVTGDILKWLDWKIEANYFYLGSGDQWTPWQKKALGRLQSVPFCKPIRFLIALSQTISLAKYKMTSIKKAFNYSCRGGLAIFDRYVQNTYFGINDGPMFRSDWSVLKRNPLTRIIYSILASIEEKYINRACSYSPDVIIKLMLSPEESIRRKPFEDYQMVKKKHEIIKELKFPESSVYTIDATKPYEEEILEIKRIIWHHLQK